MLRSVLRSRRVRMRGLAWPTAYLVQIRTGNLSSLSASTTRSGGLRRAAGHVERLRESLSERDWAVMRDVARLRLVTGEQLERLHFAELTEPSRPVVRRRVLGRLVQARVLATLERRIGGVRAGSAGPGLLPRCRRATAPGHGRASRRMDPPGERYVRHVLAVAGVFVDLTERARAGKPDGSTLRGRASLLVARRAWRPAEARRLRAVAERRSQRLTGGWRWIWQPSTCPRSNASSMAYLTSTERGQLGPDKDHAVGAGDCSGYKATFGN